MYSAFFSTLLLRRCAREQAAGAKVLCMQPQIAMFPLIKFSP